MVRDVDRDAGLEGAREDQGGREDQASAAAQEVPCSSMMIAMMKTTRSFSSC